MNVNYFCYEILYLSVLIDLMTYELMTDSLM